MRKIIVIGGANIDIIGRSLNDLVLHDSNMGLIHMSFGGVGRNIAENAARLDQEVYLVSIFSQDSLGDMLMKRCQSLNINCDFSRVMDAPSSTYLAILDQSNDMHVAIADMRLLDYMTTTDIDKIIPLIKPDDICVLDTNLKPELIEYCMDHIDAMIALDPISTHKAEKVKNLLAKLDIFKPNQYEAAALCGFPLDDEAAIIKALHYFADQGIGQILISCQAKGVYGYDHHTILHYWLDQVDIVNATGAGDALFGAYLSYTCMGYTFSQALEYAILASVVNLRSEETVALDLSQKTLKQLIKLVKIEKETVC
jgi:pseudouridine kinase